MPVLVALEGNARAEQGAFEARPFADADAAAVQLRAAPARRGEFLAQHRIDDHRVLQALFAQAGDGDAVMGDAAQEVGGAVQGVDNPEVFGVFGPAAPGFLAEHGVLRVGPAQLRNDVLLGLFIHFRDEVVGALVAYRYAA